VVKVAEPVRYLTTTMAQMVLQTPVVVQQDKAAQVKGKAVLAVQVWL
jgi:hypothetical protein